MFCVMCGREITNDSMYCPFCGKCLDRGTNCDSVEDDHSKKTGTHVPAQSMFAKKNISHRSRHRRSCDLGYCGLLVGSSLLSNNRAIMNEIPRANKVETNGNAGSTNSNAHIPEATNATNTDAIGKDLFEGMTQSERAALNVFLSSFAEQPQFSYLAIGTKMTSRDDGSYLVDFDIFEIIKRDQHGSVDEAFYSYDSATAIKSSSLMHSTTGQALR